MTELVVIPPIPHLEDTPPQPIHLTLMHLTADPLYLRHYTERSDAGDYIILDNSQHEGYVFDVRDMVYVAERMGAKELVLPDAVGDRSLTVEKARIALTLLAMDSEARHTAKGLQLSYMLVPQGQNIGDFLRCMRELVTLYEAFRHSQPKFFSKPMTIGFPVQSCGYFFPVEDLPVITRQMMRYRRKYGYNIHILGWDKSPWDLVPPMVAQAEIRSVDSSKPFSFALYELDIPTTERVRPSDYFQREFTNGELERAYHFIAEFRERLRKADAVR